MLYIDSDAARWEALEIGLETGRAPSTIVQPQFHTDTLLQLEPVSTIHITSGADLLLAPHTGSWVLLDCKDRELVSALSRPKTFGVLTDDLSTAVDPASICEFFTTLYQRGLLRIDGEPGIAPDLVAGGAIHHNANLVEIFVTQKCNLGCHYCSARAGSDMPHLNPEVAREAVDQAFLLQQDIPMSIELAGGEPFVNFRLFCDLVEYIEAKSEQYKRQVQIYTQTNGTTITPAVVDFLSKHAIGVGVSIDGPARIQNASRPHPNGTGSYDRVIRGLELLRSAGIRFGLITVLTRYSAADPDGMMHFYSSLGARSVKINPVNLIGDADETWDSVGITGTQYFDFLDRFMHAAEAANVSIRESNLSECVKHMVFRVHDYRCMRANCGAGETFFVIDARGGVYPCAHSTSIDSWRLGTVEDAKREGGFAELGARSTAVELIKRRSVESMRETAACDWRHFCEGGCAVNAFKSNGWINSRDPLCDFYERMYPRLFQRLAESPSSFQRLLDTQLGHGVARVETLAIQPA